MPLYQYECPKGHEAELMSSYPDRDKARECDVCGEALARVPTAVRFWNKHQPGALLRDGSTVRGNWGKSAPKKRR